MSGVTGVEVCGAAIAPCQCVRPPEHEPPHGCDCGGQWVGEWGSDSFQVVTYPQVGDEAFMAVLAAHWAANGVRRGGVRWPVTGE